MYYFPLDLKWKLNNIPVICSYYLMTLIFNIITVSVECQFFNSRIPSYYAINIYQKVPTELVGNIAWKILL